MSISCRFLRNSCSTGMVFLLPPGEGGRGPDEGPQFATQSVKEILTRSAAILSQSKSAYKQHFSQ